MDALILANLVAAFAVGALWAVRPPVPGNTIATGSGPAPSMP